MCRETNPTSWAILLPLVCQHQLPKMTRDRVGETPWDSAKSGPGGFWSIPPLKRPHGSSSSALVSLGRSQFTFSSTLQTAHKFLDTICLRCPEQDQNLPLQNLQHPPCLQPKGFFPIISDQRIKFRSLSCSSTIPDHTPQTAPTGRWILS